MGGFVPTVRWGRSCHAVTDEGEKRFALSQSHASFPIIPPSSVRFASSFSPTSWGRSLMFVQRLIFFSPSMVFAAVSIVQPGKLHPRLTLMAHRKKIPGGDCVRDSNPRRLRRHGVSGTCDRQFSEALRFGFSLFPFCSGETPSAPHPDGP